MCNANGHSAGCTCGFGGDGHLGRSSGFHGSASVRSYADFGDFCRPTRCHYCGASIFFVRHNGGSVWFGSLGKPWPKHDCYYINRSTSRADREIQEGIDRWLRCLTEPLIGVVIDTIFDRRANEKFVVIKCSDNTRQTLRVYITFSVEGFAGEMVIFSDKDKKLVRPYLSLETIIPLEQLAVTQLTRQQMQEAARKRGRKPSAMASSGKKRGQTVITKGRNDPSGARSGRQRNQRQQP